MFVISEDSAEIKVRQRNEGVTKKKMLEMKASDLDLPANWPEISESINSSGYYLLQLINNILDKAFQNAKLITINKNSKIVFFSDLHKGDNSYADDFRRNMEIYYHAMELYFDKGFTYIELGDGIELWENISFRPIYETYKDVFELLKRFYERKRLYLLWGNHDMEFRDPIILEKVMRTFFTPKNIADKDAVFDLEYHEGLVLEFENMLHCLSMH